MILAGSGGGLLSARSVLPESPAAMLIHHADSAPLDAFARSRIADAVLAAYLAAMAAELAALDWAVVSPHGDSSL
jgi:hypothetical protein